MIVNYYKIEGLAPIFFNRKGAKGDAKFARYFLSRAPINENAEQ
jgi:hypothetical protein